MPTVSLLGTLFKEKKDELLKETKAYTYADCRFTAGQYAVWKGSQLLHLLGKIACFLLAYVRRAGNHVLPYNYSNTTLEIKIELGFIITHLSILADNCCWLHIYQFVLCGVFFVCWLGFYCLFCLFFICLASR